MDIFHNHTIDFTSFVNWSIKNIDGIIPVYLGFDSNNICDSIEIGQDIILKNNFIAAKLDKSCDKNAVVIEYYAFGPSASKTYKKVVYHESEERPYTMFITAKNIFDCPISTIENKP